ncbi:MAG: class I SAM-dependent methyltransferase [Nocardioides sp.]
MSFEVAPEAYDRFMGRYADPLAVVFADSAGIEAGAKVLDVGCGPGALTAELARRVGETSVAAVDPSPPFVAAARKRLPAADVRQASAEHLPFPDGTFDAALAQLVVHFMDDPVRGLGEMARVVRPGGAVAACVWNHAGGDGPLSTFWESVRSLDGEANDESGLCGVEEGQLDDLCVQAGLRDIESGRLQVQVTFSTFEDWWGPFTLGVGPAGAYVAGLGDDARSALRERCAERLPPAPFTLKATAWSVRARV